MTTVYFVRHAQPNYHNHNDLSRELTEKGLRDRELVTEYLEDKNIHAVLSSPFKRAVDTVAQFAEEKNLPIRLIEDFRERKIEDCWIADFESFCRSQWADFDYKLPGGESLREVQDRNIRALNDVLTEYRGQNVVIGSHGTAMAVILNWFDHSFGYKDFSVIRHRMPWVVKLVFQEGELQKMELTDVYSV